MPIKFADLKQTLPSTRLEKMEDLTIRTELTDGSAVLRPAKLIVLEDGRKGIVYAEHLGSMPKIMEDADGFACIPDEWKLSQPAEKNGGFGVWHAFTPAKAVSTTAIPV